MLLSPTQLAREKRKYPTEAEAALWQLLRNRQAGNLKFLRQHVFIYSSYRNKKQFLVADFYCPQHRLVIEVDGGYHDGIKEKDKERDQLLEDLFGISVIRFGNEEVLLSPEKVVRKILVRCK